MHESATHTSGAPLEAAVMAAIAAVPNALRRHALDLVAAYTAQSDRTAADPNASTNYVHQEQAAKWASIARERGASQHQITAAYQEGHHTATLDQ